MPRLQPLASLARMPRVRRPYGRASDSVELRRLPTITEQDKGKDKGDNKSKAQRELEAFQEIERQRIEEEDIQRQRIVKKFSEMSFGTTSVPTPALPSTSTSSTAGW